MNQISYICGLLLVKFKMLLLLLLTTGALFAHGLVPQVVLPDGTLQGFPDKTYNNRPYIAFEGIPYARPPVGKYRFREPQPIKPWNGVWIANHTVKCIQYSHLSLNNDDRILGQEDCLYLNVYTPSLDQNALLDVIVHIHGGAFMFNAGYLYGPKLLLSRNVVFVTLNYRLGPFGFLSTEDDVVAGNMGLKDQTFALKWIQNNIKYFGGNPNSVTITGLSAGGASVTYHYLSPLSAGLFHKGIALSGVALNPWAEVEGSLEKAKKLANGVGCHFTRIDDMINCLRYRPATQILSKIGPLFQPYLYNPFSPFGPVVEKSKTPFLADSPYKLLRKGLVSDAPLIITTVQDEGLYPAAEFKADPTYLPEIDQRWGEVAPLILDYNYTAPLSQHKSVSQRIKNQYLQNQPISDATYKNFVQMIGDRLFTTTIEKAGKMFAKSMASEVYMMYFGYRGKYSRSTRLSQSTDNLGVCHADDLIYVTSADWANPLDNKNDALMTEVLLEMWTSFAESGVPTISGVDFTPMSKGKGPLNYLHIESPTKKQMKNAETLSQVEFWDSLPINENEHIVQLKEEL